MAPLTPEDAADVERIAEAARKRARLCPICKVGDAVYRGKCQNCGAVCVDSVWQVFPKVPETAPQEVRVERVERKEDTWDPLKL